MKWMVLFSFVVGILGCGAGGPSGGSSEENENAAVLEQELEVNSYLGSWVRECMLVDDQTIELSRGDVFVDDELIEFSEIDETVIDPFELYWEEGLVIGESAVSYGVRLYGDDECATVLLEELVELRDDFDVTFDVNDVEYLTTKGDYEYNYYPVYPIGSSVLGAYGGLRVYSLGEKLYKIEYDNIWNFNEEPRVFVVNFDKYFVRDED